MNAEFPKIITFLRKQRGLTQKQAAADMGISQALLSHYEKGVRECGLDFLVKSAEYYDVSCDYLLGRTANRNYYEENSKNANNDGKNNIVNNVNKKLMSNTLDVIFDILSQISDKKLTNAVSNYLMSSEYEILRQLCKGETGNLQTMFTLKSNRYQKLCNISMLLDLELIEEITEKKDRRLSSLSKSDLIYFENNLSSVITLIRYAERNVKSNCKSAFPD